MANINIDEAKLAKYLQVAVNQRKRALAKFIQDYGPNSATVAECQGEVAELEVEINNMLKAAAQSPKLQGRK